MAQDIQATGSNQNKSSQAGANSTQAKQSAIGNASSQPKPLIADPSSPFKNPANQNNSPLTGFRPSRFWLIFAGIASVVLILIFVLSFYLLNKKAPPDLSQSPQTAEKVIEQSPVALPAIKSEDTSADELKVYFVSVSPVFNEEFMAQVPEIAKDAYKKYKETGEPLQKLEAARAFFIYLNNPGSKTDDPIFQEFLNDVKTDLEKTLGRVLFGE